MCDKKTPELVEYYKEKSRKGESLILIFSDGMENRIRLKDISDKPSGYVPPKVREPYVFRMPTPVSESPRPPQTPEEDGCFSTPKKEVKSSKFKINKGSSQRLQSKRLMTPKSKILKDAASPSSANPFQIYLVLNKVFGYVKKKDIPACRLVCKKWNLNIIPRFRDEFEIYVCTVDHSKPIPYRNTTPPDCKFKKDHKSLERFVKLMRTSISIPFTKFRMDLNTKLNVNKTWMTQFLRICGTLITHVTLENWTLDYDPFFEKSVESDLIENLNEMFKVTKNLEYLHLKTTFYYNKKKENERLDRLEENLPALKILSFNGYNWPRGKFPTIINDFIAHSPNLIDVSFTDTPWDRRDLLSALVSPDRVSNIQNLKTESFRIKKEFVDQAEKCGLKLKKLHTTDPDLDDRPPMYRLIELQKDNLSQFICCLDGFAAHPTGMEPELPKMINLKVLRIGLKNSSSFSMRCTEKNFCEKFPNIEILTFYFGEEDMNLDFLGSQCCPKLKSMELDFYKVDLPGFQHMAEIYSSSALTSLTLNTGRFSNPKILKLIWSNLKNLRELELVFTVKSFKGDLDSIFTGISIEDCKRIKKNPTCWNFMNTKGKRFGKRKKLAKMAYELRDSPSIADLKSLNRLSLKFPGSGLTDITGYLGLYELENIRHIHIDFCEFSKTCCESLLSQLNSESWVFRVENRAYVQYKYTGDLLGPFSAGIWSRPGPNNKDIVPPYFYPYEEMESLSINTI